MVIGSRVREAACCVAKASAFGTPSERNNSGETRQVPLADTALVVPLHTGRIPGGNRSHVQWLRTVSYQVETADKRL